MRHWHPPLNRGQRSIEAIECVPVEGNSNLFLVPGHIRLTEYEVGLGMAQQLSGTIPTLQNLPGSLSYLMEKTGRKYEAEYILIDMNPSLSSINQNLLMTSDYFLVPASPDFFSVMAINSLTSVLPRWRAWSKQASTMEVFREATYPFPATVPKFLGTIIQRYRIRQRAAVGDIEEGPPTRGMPTAGFQKWIDEINKTVKEKFVPMLRQQGMLLDEQKYQQLPIDDDYCLAAISDFNSLIAKSQEFQVPVFALTDQQIGLTGVGLQNTRNTKDQFERIFSTLADMIVELTSDAAGS